MCHFCLLMLKTTCIKFDSELQVRIADSIYHGPLEAKIYDFWGPVCKKDWDDRDANVTCHQLGYIGGVAFKGSTTLKTPTAVGRFNCTGLETKLGYCSYKTMGDDLGCSSAIQGIYTRPTAGVLCYNNKGEFSVNGSSPLQCSPRI